MNHFTERPLAFDGVRDVRVMPAIDTPKHALVFVHGFGGQALSTWTRFHSLLPSEPQTADYDLFFYGYDGFSADLVATAGILGQFITRIATDVTYVAKVLPSDSRKGFAGYNKILIAAHSLGAVTARWAILDGIANKSKWANVVSMILFAPAHSGANVVKLALAGFSGFGVLHLLSAAIQFKSPLVAQLKPRSGELKDLEKRTRKALPSNTQAAAKRVLIAQYERIVSNLPFFGDPVPSFAVADATHTTICKPAAVESVSLQKLLEVL